MEAGPTASIFLELHLGHNGEVCYPEMVGALHNKECANK